MNTRMRTYVLTAAALALLTLAGCALTPVHDYAPTGVPTSDRVPPVSHVVEPPAAPPVTLPPTVETRTVTVEVPGPTVEVPVEVEVPATPSATDWDGNPITGTGQELYDAGWASGYDSGRAEGEEWVTENVNACGQVLCELDADGYPVIPERDATDDAYDRGYERGGADQYTGFALALSTPCAEEDSESCYWLGGENGEGAKFVRLGGITFVLAE